MKANRVIVPVENSKDQNRAKERISEILADKEIYIPNRFREESDKLALYNPKGIFEKANALLLEGDGGAYDLGID